MRNEQDSNGGRVLCQRYGLTQIGPLRGHCQQESKHLQAALCCDRAYLSAFHSLDPWQSHI